MQVNAAIVRAVPARATGRQIGKPQAIVLPQGCPFAAYVCAVLLPLGCLPPPGGLGIRIGAGVAMQAEEARRICLLEGIERYSLQYRSGDRRRYPATAIAGGASAEADDSAILLGHPGRDATLAPVDSRGCAAGRSLADAALRGLLELIEFEAVDRWRAGDGGFCPVTPAESDVAAIGKWLATRGQTQRFLQWRHPGGATVAIAVTSDHDGRHPTLGSAAGLEPLAAMRHASLESAFTSINLAEVDRRNRDGAGLAPADRKELAIYRGEVALPPVAGGNKAGDPGEAKAVDPGGAELAKLSRLIAAMPRPVAIFDLTRPEIGIAVARTILLPADGRSSGGRAGTGPRLRRSRRTR